MQAKPLEKQYFKMIKNNDFKWYLTIAPHYKWTKSKICINTKTNRVIKKVYKERCLGYLIDGEFKSLSFLRKYVKIITA